MPYDGSAKHIDIKKRLKERLWGEGLRDLAGCGCALCMSVLCGRLSTLKENLLLDSVSCHTPVGINGVQIN